MSSPLLLRFLSFLSVLCCGVALAAPRPNILLILLDDAGWTDVACYGSRIETPAIDALAASGMRFTDCHSAAPNCSPSRAGLLTGRIPARTGIYSYLPAGHVMHLRDEEVTLAEVLRDAGYRTGHFGKWHLSRLQSEQPGPRSQGFDHSLGTDNNAAPSHRNPRNFVRNGEPVGELSGYSCHLVVDETIRWLSDTKESQRPFFACVWFHEPHTPIASPPELVQKYRKRYPELSKKEATYHANVENADAAIGKLVNFLEHQGLTNETLIFFTSDNGPLAAASHVGLRGRKSHLYEGGHRVPGIFRWPDHIQAKTTCDVPVSGIDFLPTVCEVLELPLPPRHIDGVSLWPLLASRAKRLDRRQPLYWFFYRLNPAIALRRDHWALLATTNDAQRPKAHPLVREDMAKIRHSLPTQFELYDLRTDLPQRRDVGEQFPSIRLELVRELQALHQSVVREGHPWDIPRDYGENSNRRVWNSD